MCNADSGCARYVGTTFQEAGFLQHAEGDAHARALLLQVALEIRLADPARGLSAQVALCCRIGASQEVRFDEAFT